LILSLETLECVFSEAYEPMIRATGGAEE